MNKITNILKLGIISMLIFVLSGCAENEPPTDGSQTQFRRLTENQYRNTIKDVFGRNIIISGRFDPLERIDGLLSIGASHATISPVALERYEALGRSIALQVVNKQNRIATVACRPSSILESDTACAEQFFSDVGRFIFRRPLSDSELQMYVGISGATSKLIGDFYKGLGYGLAGMLVSPKFLYVNETSEPDPEEPGKYRLDAHSKAARLSFLLWNTTPDAHLLNAAASGKLDTKDGLKQQFSRMMASSRTEEGIRAFFSDMLEFERFETMEKDPIIYPAFVLQVPDDAEEQTLRTLTHLLLAEEADYRDIFTSRKTFISGSLGPIYRVPVRNPAGWAPYEFPETSPWAGIHTQLSFQALFSHPGKSSPTLRGQAVREHLLCQKIPEPPGDVDFSDFNDDSDPVNKTARQRLEVHNREASCAGCHKLMDPIGLAMEQFDGAGQFRTKENGRIIETFGELDGIPYQNALGLGKALRDNPAAPTCVVHRLYSYASGRSPNPSEREWMRYLEKKFAKAGYSVPELLKEIVLSRAFYRVALPEFDKITHGANLADSSPG